LVEAGFKTASTLTSDFGSACIRMNTHKATQNDVAKLAGVSQSLVSLVLSESVAPVADETREQILEAARKLGYPLRGGRKISRGRRLLAYIRPSVDRERAFDGRVLDSYDQFYNQIQNYLVEKAYMADFEMIVRPYTRPVEVTHWLIEWGVEGVFWHSNDLSLAGWVADRYPTVQINRHLKIAADAVLPNQEEIMMQAINHLRLNGHDRIALVSQGRTDTTGHERARAYLACMRQYQGPGYEEWVNEKDLDKIVDLLVARSPSGPTALILGDMQALYLQNKLRRAGFSLPDDLSMVGIDNITASEFSSPRLTSVDLQVEEIVNAAVSAMTSRLNGASGARKKVEVSPRLVSRDSVALRGHAGVIPSRKVRRQS